MAFNTLFVAINSNKISLHGMRWNHDERPQSFRNPFSKDRDRILYSKSFLRLLGKTQVFMQQKNDYIRTRLTHSLEVNQLAKTIASALNLNVDLVEAIALGHDVGHTPFGHVGERRIKELLDNDPDIPLQEKGFKHNLQALRLLCDLEKGADFPNHKGLNLTKYTLWGISHHSSIPYKKDDQGHLIQPLEPIHPIYEQYLNAIKDYWSFEGLIVALADEIAQRHHDIEDSLRYRIIDRETLLDEIGKFSPLFKAQEKLCFSRLRKEIKALDEPVFTSLFARLVINLYVNDAINQSKTNIRNLGSKYNISNQQSFIDIKPTITKADYEKCISLTPKLSILDKDFQNFLKEKVLSSYQAQAMDGKAQFIIKKLYKAFVDTPQQLPDTSLRSFYSFVSQQNYSRNNAIKEIDAYKDVFKRCVADYIGGMTDRFAYDEYDRLYGTKI